MSHNGYIYLRASMVAHSIEAFTTDVPHFEAVKADLNNFIRLNWRGPIRSDAADGRIEVAGKSNPTGRFWTDSLGTGTRWVALMLLAQLCDRSWEVFQVEGDISGDFVAFHLRLKE